MSSTLTQQYLTSLNIKMLKRVLDTTGLFDVDSAWHREKRRDAARYLITAFQDGVHSEAALSASLMRQIKVFSSPSSPISIADPLQKEDERRWENEGGSMAFRHRHFDQLIKLGSKSGRRKAETVSTRRQPACC
ncbi:hypothetical protein AB4Z34_35035 [Ensifer sp. 2YAB10]|uniref:hypothetical protein n=1 Tax=unclassified Ensifer TaxID=2633371 RepID=UPI003F92FA27